jgi:hypothetical protein
MITDACLTQIKYKDFKYGSTIPEYLDFLPEAHASWTRVMEFIAPSGSNKKKIKKRGMYYRKLKGNKREENNGSWLGTGVRSSLGRSRQLNSVLKSTGNSIGSIGNDILLSSKDANGISKRTKVGNRFGNPVSPRKTSFEMFIKKIKARPKNTFVPTLPINARNKRIINKELLRCMDLSKSARDLRVQMKEEQSVIKNMRVSRISFNLNSPLASPLKSKTNSISTAMTSSISVLTSLKDKNKDNFEKSLRTPVLGASRKDIQSLLLSKRNTFNSFGSPFISKVGGKYDISISPQNINLKVPNEDEFISAVS